MNLLTPENAFSLMMAGRNIECRNTSCVPPINEFEPVSEFSACVFALPGYEFRQAVNFIQLGEHSYPEAETATPEIGVEFYIPSLTRDDFFASFTWNGDESQIKSLERSMVHLNQQSAIDHAKAIILAGGGTFPQRVSISFNNVIPAVQQMLEDSENELLATQHEGVLKKTHVISK